ncbi:MAG: arginine--tRNA ligase [Bacteroidetes bacterium]|nr:arginine--tRNA ligase [Bacteroidota bacterium]
MKSYLEQQIRAALSVLEGAPDDFDTAAVAVEFQTPNNLDHGDLATNVAMQLARPLRRAPRQIAEALVEALTLDPKRIEGVEIAGPGFINFRFSNAYLADGVAHILEEGEAFGRTNEGAGKTAIVEYVSANPTGPLTVGHGRNAVLGDTIANLLEWTGYDVTREYYFNDAGRQMRVLGESVRARVEGLVNPDGPTKTLEDGTVVPESFPDDAYRGEYIETIAESVLAGHGANVLAQEDLTVFKEAAETAIFADIKATLARIDIRMDEFFNERSVYDSDAVWDVVKKLREKDLIYDKDGAVWFATGKLGKKKTDEHGEHEVDTVLVKSTGEPTYRLPDIAYHMDKLARGFDKIVDVFGADHIATYPDVLRGVEALGGDISKIDVVIYQFVTLVRGGQPVKMSTRKANFVTLDELMDEVTPDVTRFFFLMRSPNSHLEFDLDLAKEAGEKNPVFYLQYAHARICSIIRKAGEVGLTLETEPDLSLLDNESEVVLMKELLRLPEVIAQSADVKEPHKVATYLREVATAFSQFYRDSHIIGADSEALGLARLHLAKAAQLVLHNGLAVLGISAPERM